MQGGTLHQPVFPVLPVQGEGLPHQNGCGSPSEADTDPLIDTRHIEDDKQHEKGKQPSGEDEQILAFESLKLYRATDSLVNRIGLHRLRGRNFLKWWLRLSRKYTPQTSLRLSSRCPGRLTKILSTLLPHR